MSIPVPISAEPCSVRIGNAEARGVRFYVPAMPSSQNHGGLRGAHWSAVAHERRQWSQLVAATIGPWLERPLLWPVRLSYVRHYYGATPDLDNIATTIKPVQDALQDLGVLEDDKDVDELVIGRVRARSAAHRGIEVEAVEL